jgi:hypothetical protein
MSTHLRLVMTLRMNGPTPPVSHIPQGLEREKFTFILVYV